MSVQITRRIFLYSGIAASVLPGSALAIQSEVWSAPEAHKDLSEGKIRMIDVRSRAEWRETGLARNAWPISMHEPRFSKRLFTARDFAAEAPVALICATGGRSAYLLKALKRAGYNGFIDVSEGMLGSSLGPGWIRRGLPIVQLETALADLPKKLR